MLSAVNGLVIGGWQRRTDTAISHKENSLSEKREQRSNWPLPASLPPLLKCFKLHFKLWNSNRNKMTTVIVSGFCFPTKLLQIKTLSLMDSWQVQAQARLFLLLCVNDATLNEMETLMMNWWMCSMCSVIFSFHCSDIFVGTLCLLATICVHQGEMPIQS